MLFGTEETDAPGSRGYLSLFGHPKECMGDFSNLVNKMNEDCKKYNIPILGGNVSLYNSTDDISIKPTLVLMMIGIIDL